MQMQKADKRPYLLFVGRSGSGKSTVADILAEQGLRVLSSYTTRKPRSPEEKGHIFIDNEDFNNLSDICAYTEFDGYRYCATNEQIENSDIYIIDIAGVNYFKAAYTGEKDIVVMYFGITPSIAFGRMLDRGDTVMKAAERLEHDNIAFSNENVEQLMSLFPVRKVGTGLGAGYASIKIMEFWESRMKCYKKDCNLTVEQIETLGQVIDDLKCAIVDIFSVLALVTEDMDQKKIFQKSKERIILMKAKEYFDKYKDLIMREVTSESTEFRYPAELLKEMSMEAQKLVDARHAVRNSAVVAVLKEFNVRWNAVVSMFIKKYGVSPMKKDGFKTWWCSQDKAIEKAWNRGSNALPKM